MTALNSSAPVALFAPGDFTVGCNYWASHAGARMWSDWRPDIVRDDLAQLAAAGLQIVRVFPLWPDFQPLTNVRGFGGAIVELRFGEIRRPETAAGEAGMDEVMLDRFRFLADTAGEHGLRLVVSLITGWMSGRFYAPPALESLDALRDPVSRQWQLRFARHFVRAFREHPAIAAWGLGNECNCMGRDTTTAEAWTWTAALAATIRAEDARRPILSDMHSLQADPEAPWSIASQGELTDVLTTHPYPNFTPHCRLDPLDSPRAILHGTIESRLYADLGGRPCIAGEIGSLGPMNGDAAVTSAYARTALLSLWAHDVRGFWWWCAYDQAHLRHAPYAWNAHETELGLIAADRTPKPVLAEVAAFRRWRESLPFAALPPRIVDGVCVLTHGQDGWAAAFGAALLGKQAGLELAFSHASRRLPDAKLYLVPSVRGAKACELSVWEELLCRVEAGALLYISGDDAEFSQFTRLTGASLVRRERRTRPLRFTLGGSAVEAPAMWRAELSVVQARVLAAEEDGNPVCLVRSHGAGTVVFCAADLEVATATTPGLVNRRGGASAAVVYRKLAELARPDRVALAADPMLGLTEHPSSDRDRIVVAINHGRDEVSVPCPLRDGWTLHEVLRGNVARDGALRVDPHEAAVFRVVRR